MASERARLPWNVKMTIEFSNDQSWNFKISLLWTNPNGTCICTMVNGIILISKSKKHVKLLSLMNIYLLYITMFTNFPKTCKWFCDEKIHHDWPLFWEPRWPISSCGACPGRTLQRSNSWEVAQPSIHSWPSGVETAAGQSSASFYEGLQK